MRPGKENPATVATARGRESNKASSLKIDDTTQGARIIAFQPRRQPRCVACGQHLTRDHYSKTCPCCEAWDAILRATALRHQALAGLKREGGVR